METIIAQGDNINGQSVVVVEKEKTELQKMFDLITALNLPLHQTLALNDAITYYGIYKFHEGAQMVRDIYSPSKSAA